VKRRRFLLIDERSDAIDSVTRVLELSGYVVLTGDAAEKALSDDSGAPTECWRQPAPEHHARELLNRIMLLTNCLALDGVTALERRQWTRQIGAAQMGLEALFASGLDRDFLSRKAG
jgi:hypothetical protein